MFWDESNETWERLKRKTEVEKIENVNKIKAYRLRKNQYSKKQKEKQKC